MVFETTLGTYNESKMSYIACKITENLNFSKQMLCRKPIKAQNTFYL